MTSGHLFWANCRLWVTFGPWISILKCFAYLWRSRRYLKVIICSCKAVKTGKQNVHFLVVDICCKVLFGLMISWKFLAQMPLKTCSVLVLLLFEILGKKLSSTFYLTFRFFCCCIFFINKIESIQIFIFLFSLFKVEII